MFSASSQNTINFTRNVWCFPNISGELENTEYSLFWAGTIESSGAISTEGSKLQVNTSVGGSAPAKIIFDASLSNAIYNQSNTVQPNSNQVLIIIKT